MIINVLMGCTMIGISGLGIPSGIMEQIDFTAKDDFGYIAEIEVANGNGAGFIISQGDWQATNCDEDQRILVEDDTEIWVTEGQCGYVTEAPEGAGEKLLSSRLVEMLMNRQ